MSWIGLQGVMLFLERETGCEVKKKEKEMELELELEVEAGCGREGCMIAQWRDRV